jgi:DNA-directed RNA polymerase subunit H (RpoH/RPB5)
MVKFKVSKYSLVMEFASSGDVYGEIIRLQRESSFAEEDWVWRILI